MWLTKRVDIPQATEEDLRRSLLTSDGMGPEFKTECLEELLKRKEIHALSVSEEDQRH